MVAVLDAATNKITATIAIKPTVGQGFRVGRAFAPSPDGKRLYLAGGNVSTIDTDKNTVVAENGDIAAANAIAISPDGSKAYVGSGYGLIGVIDLPTNKVIAWITRPDAYKTNAGIWVFRTLALSPDGKRLYAVNLYPPFSDVTASAMSVIDTATNLVVANIPVDPPAYFTDLIVSRDNANLYYNSGRTLAAIDTATNAIRVPSSPIATSGMALSPDGNLLYLNTYSGPQAMYAIEATPKTGSPFSDTPLLSVSIPPFANYLGNNLTQLAIDPTTNLVYSLESAGQSAVVSIDPAKKDINAVVPLGPPIGITTPFAIAIIGPPKPISVTVQPQTVTLALGRTQQFTASVLNDISTAVTWSMSPQAGSLSAAGI